MKIVQIVAAAGLMFVVVPVAVRSGGTQKACRQEIIQDCVKRLMTRDFCFWPCCDSTGGCRAILCREDAKLLILLRYAWFTPISGRTGSSQRSINL